MRNGRLRPTFCEREKRGVHPLGGTPRRLSAANRFGMLSRRRSDQSISKVRAVSLSAVMRTVMTFSGSSCSIFSGHSTRQRSPE